MKRLWEVKVIEEKEGNVQNAKSDKKVIMVKYKGKLSYEEDVMEKRKEGKQEENIFSTSHKGDIIVEANIKNKYKSKSKVQYVVKIASFIHN